MFKYYNNGVENQLDEKKKDNKKNVKVENKKQLLVNFILITVLYT
jgi:hypothetical protein